MPSMPLHRPSLEGTPPSSPVLATTMITHDIVEGAAISSGANNADKSFLLPGPGFVSPVEGVAGGLEADGGGGRSGDSNPSTRRNLRKTVEGRDELFKRRLKQLRHKDMLFELMEDGTYEMKHMSMREVFNYVQGMARFIYLFFWGGKSCFFSYLESGNPVRTRSYFLY